MTSWGFVAYSARKFHFAKNCWEVSYHNGMHYDWLLTLPPGSTFDPSSRWTFEKSRDRNLVSGDVVHSSRKFHFANIFRRPSELGIRSRRRRHALWFSFDLAPRIDLWPSLKMNLWHITRPWGPGSTYPGIDIIITLPRDQLLTLPLTYLDASHPYSRIKHEDCPPGFNSR